MRFCSVDRPQRNQRGDRRAIRNGDDAAVCSAMRLPLISGITSGTFGSIRKADELSMTTAPALTAIGANFLAMPLPAENSAMSTPSKESSVSSSTTIASPRKPSVLPAERALASALSLPTGNRALVHGGDEFGAYGAGHAGNCNNGIALHFRLHQAIKKPRTFSGGASVQMMRSQLYARTTPEAPRGLAGFRGAFCVSSSLGRQHMGGTGWRQRLSMGPENGYNEG